jgi:uncharacterized oligopeptide transporter (OPT) family protein
MAAAKRCERGRVIVSSGAEGPVAERHPAFFSAISLLLIAPLCVVGAIVGTQLIVTLGITTNTSLIGALAGIALGRIPFAAFRHYRSTHMQNLAQSAISAATFGAGNALLLPIGIPFVMGMPELILPMLLGVFLATLLDGYLLYRMFDSEVFPSSAAWPPGMAAAEAITAGDEGGRKLWVLGGGIAVGVAGNALFGIPMSAFGVAFIGNIWALAMFGVGLLIRSYSAVLFNNASFAGIFPGGDIAKVYLPQGFMLGAGLVALAQIIVLMLRSDRSKAQSTGTGTGSLRSALGFGSAGYLAIALLLAVLAGLATAMPVPMLVGFIVYAAFAALIHELIVGLSAMHAGWFPAFGVAVVTLAVGILLGFPPVALTVMVGFTASTGPAFADMGYDLKAGHLLRGCGADPAFERDGRRQQLFAAIFAFVVAGLVVAFANQFYFANNLVAPIDKVYAASINAGASAEVAEWLLIWAAPGALLQLIGGPTRQIGTLLATGLLLGGPLAGWAVLVGIALRFLWERLAPKKWLGDMTVFGAGAIAGDALYSFYDLGTRYARAN